MTKRIRRVIAALSLSVWAALAQMPPPGPPAQPQKTVVFVASDFRNGGVMAVYRGLEEACKSLGWKLVLENGNGLAATQSSLLARAVTARADGVVFGGFDPDAFHAEVAAALKGKTVLVGWHAAKEPGPTRELFVNVSTRAQDVAKMAADHVLRDAATQGRPVGVVLFNDKQYAVANAKTAVMKQTIEACKGHTQCKVLSVENVRISDAAADMASVVPRLLKAHGAQWTYSLAINDVYFDEIHFPLLRAGRSDIRHVSAGDGSAKAVGRIGAGVSQQIATVAEPLMLHGYQLADELNRAFAGAAPSGFQSRPILVTTELLARMGTQAVDSSPEIQALYRAQWGRK